MDALQTTLDLVRSGKTDAALDAFQRLVADPAFRAEALGHRAWLLRSLGRYEEAIQDYQVLTEAAPDNFDARALLAETLLLAGQPDLSIQAVADSIGAHLRHPTALRYLHALHSSLPVDNSPEERTAVPSPAWPVNPVIAVLEKSDTSYPASCFPEIGRFLYDFTRLAQPEIVVETGTYIGYSSLCIAQALEHNGSGHLHSFDLFMDHTRYASPIVGQCRDALQVARTHAEKAGLASRITFHKGDSSVRMRQFLGGHHLEASLVFIDADHTISGCFKDWNSVLPFVRENGFVLLHDIRPEKCGWLGPCELLDRLSQTAPGAFQMVRLPSPEGFGVGIIQKTGKNEGKVRFTLKDLLRDRLFNRADRKSFLSIFRDLRCWLGQ